MVQQALAFFATILLCVAAGAADQDKPRKITSDEAKGSAFSAPDAQQHSGKYGTVTNRELLVSKDKKYTAGMFKAGASDMPIDAYPDDEFCYFLSGTVTLTSADGTTVELKQGDAVVIPKGWKGRWTTPGYTKYYVIYK